MTYIVRIDIIVSVLTICFQKELFGLFLCVDRCYFENCAGNGGKLNSMSDPKALCDGDPRNGPHLGLHVRHLSKSIRLSIDEALDREFAASEESRLTSVQAHVLGYLNMQDELGNVVYQKDIEQVFHIRRSTATGILKLLEQCGSIRRESEEKDARLKKITVTDKARQTKKRVDNAIDGVEKRLIRGITEEEINTFIELTEKMRRNLEND